MAHERDSRSNRPPEVNKEGGFPHRNIPSHHPEKTKAKLDEITSGNPIDKVGSQEDNRGGPLRGAPDITWYSFDSKRSVVTVPLSTERTVHVQGYNFMWTTGVYLSADNVDMFTIAPKSYDLFGTYDNRLNTEYPAFDGIPVVSWTVINNTNMTFTLSAPLSTGYIDIIFTGPAGYAKASSSVYTDSQSATTLITVVSS